MQRTIVPKQNALVERNDPPIPYGLRHFRRVGLDGKETWDIRPITPEESFDPEEGDVISQRPTHTTDIVYLNDVLDRRSTGQGLLLSDCIINWNIKGLRQHSPDFAFFPGVVRPPGDWGIYRVKWNRVRARFIIEVTSPETRENDLVTKVEEYHRAGVAAYVIVDRYATDTPPILGYRYMPAGFVPMPLDENGRLLLEPVGVLLGFEDDHVVCFDAATGDPIGDYQVIWDKWEEAEEKRAEAEKLAQQSAEALKKANARERRQAKARQAAEDLARQRAEALKVAEQRGREQAEALEAAEHLARQRAEALRAVEERERQAAERLHQLEEELRRLRGAD